MLSSLYDTRENVYYIHKILIIIRRKRSAQTLRVSTEYVFFKIKNPIPGIYFPDQIQIRKRR